jgi:hypothetical protein
VLHKIPAQHPEIRTRTGQLPSPQLIPLNCRNVEPQISDRHGGSMHLPVKEWSLPLVAWACV